MSELLTIRAASDFLHVPTPTIRSWERRYEIPCVSRTAGGHRRYTAEEIRMLQQMRHAIAQGHRAVAAAALVKAAAGGSSQPLVQALLDASEHLESKQVGEVLDRAERTLGLSRTVDEVLVPALPS